MNSEINKLVPASIISSLVSLIISYALLYSWSTEGFSKAEVIYGLLAPCIVFFVVTLIVQSAFIRSYLRVSESPQKWYYVFVITTLITIVSSIVIDYTYFNIDSFIFKDYSSAAANTLMEVGETQRSVDAFEDSIFFVQGIFQNLLSITVACLVASVINRRSVSSKSSLL